jgi:hypothetical protein
LRRSLTIRRSFDLHEINQALNDPYLQLRDNGADPRLVAILSRLRYTPFGENLVVCLLALAFVASDPAVRPPLGRIAEALSDLGWRHSDRSPVSADVVRWATEDTVRVLEHITIGPRRRSERRRFSEVAAELARDALLNC